MKITNLLKQFQNKDLIVIIAEDIKLLKDLSSYFLSSKILCDKTIFMTEIPYNEIIKRDYQFFTDLKHFAYELNTCTMIFMQYIYIKKEKLCLTDPNIDFAITATNANKGKNKTVDFYIKKNRRGPVGTVRFEI